MKSLLFLLIGFQLSVGAQATFKPSVVAAGYITPTPITVAPGQIITFFVHGVGAGVTQAVFASGIPLPASLAGISAVIKQFNPDLPVPMLSVQPVATCADPSQAGCGAYTAITVQMPFEMQADDPTQPRGVPVGSAEIVFTENGAAGARVDLTAVVDQIHLLRTCDLLYQRRTSACRPIVAHADGSLVNAQNPAKGGEEVVVYGFGLGVTNPNVETGKAPISPVNAVLPFKISFDPRQNALASRPPFTSQGLQLYSAPIFVGLTPNYVGLYQINIIVPSLPAGSLPCSSFNGIPIESNLTINVAGPASFDGVGICAQPTPGQQ